MDFITGFPRMSKQHDSIMVVVDKLTKATHFIPLKTTHKAADVADIFLKEVEVINGSRGHHGSLFLFLKIIV
jgi:hypothetical protein